MELGVRRGRVCRRRWRCGQGRRGGFVVAREIGESRSACDRRWDKSNYLGTVCTLGVDGSFEYLLYARRPAEDSGPYLGARVNLWVVRSFHERVTDSYKLKMARATLVQAASSASFKPSGFGE